MEWTLISWAIGLILASPLFGLISKQLDHGYNPQLIARAATAIGSLFCLPLASLKPHTSSHFILQLLLHYTLLLQPPTLAILALWFAATLDQHLNAANSQLEEASLAGSRNTPLLLVA